MPCSQGCFPVQHIQVLEVYTAQIQHPLFSSDFFSFTSEYPIMPKKSAFSDGNYSSGSENSAKKKFDVNLNQPRTRSSIGLHPASWQTKAWWRSEIWWSFRKSNPNRQTFACDAFTGEYCYLCLFSCWICYFLPWDFHHRKGKKANIWKEYVFIICFQPP